MGTNIVMSKNEAIRLGETIRDRMENVKQTISDSIPFASLREDIQLAQQESLYETGETIPRRFMTLAWKDKIQKAFLLQQLGIELIAFESVDKMNQYILQKYNEPKALGNSYIVKTNENKYEIGQFYLDILGLIHELGHILQSTNLTTSRICWDSNIQDPVELRVDTFARSFWMPKKLFEEQVSMHTKDNICNVKSVADYFAVDFISALIRGKELCIWD